MDVRLCGMDSMLTSKQNYPSNSRKSAQERYSAKWQDFTSLQDSKPTLDLHLWTRLEEKSKTSTNGDGSSRVNAGQINEITNQNHDEIDAINRRHYNSGRQMSSSPKCNYCKKIGHIEENCWKKNGKPNGNQSASNQPLGQHQDNAKKCTYCGMKNHTTDKCFKMIANQKRIEKARTDSKVNKVEQDNDCDHQSKN